MGTPKNTIRINGKLYDTTTGKPVVDAHIITPSQTPAAPAPPKTHVSDSTATSIPVRVTPSTSRPKVERNTGTTSHAVHHKTEHTKTLMRHVVKKPSRAKKITVSGLVPQPEKHELGKAHKQHDRAADILRSKHITKFANTSPKFQHKVETIAVKAAPAHASRTAEKDLPVNYSLKQAPPVMLKHKEHKSQTSSQLFETALKSANHHQPSHIGGKKHRKGLGKIARIGSSLAVVLLLGGFFAYHNMTGLALRSASAKAGFAASLPNYKPVGFSLGSNVEAEGNKVILRYTSNSGGNGFVLTQQPIQGDNTTLTSTELRNQKYLTATQGNRQVLIFGNSNAMWVHNGIWYTIAGNAQLSTDQLVSIASSI